jgi:hypothetical protein
MSEFLKFLSFCELFVDLFESVYNVDTCDSDTEDVSGPSDGCGFSGIWLRMFDLEAVISGLDAAFLLLLLNSALMG